MKFAAIALVLFMSAALSGERVQAFGREQTDWYSRGIIRQQTINVMSAKQKRKQYQKKKKRKAHATPHRKTSRSRSVAAKS